MSISRKAFEQTPNNVNLEVLDQLIKHPNEAFSLTTMKKKFGNDVVLSLTYLVFNGQAEMRFDETKKEYWYILKRSQKK